MKQRIKNNLALIGCLFILFGTAAGGLRGEEALLSPEAFGEQTIEGKEIYSFQSARSHGQAVLPFADDLDSERFCIDEDVSLNLTGQESFILEVSLDQPKAVHFITLYFRVPGGWYSLPGKPVGFISANRRVQYLFRMSDVKIEEKPAGIDKINSIRIAFWRGDSVNARAEVHSLKTVEREMFAVVADPEKAQGDASLGGAYLSIFKTFGFSFTTIQASHLSDLLLRKASAVLIPISANLNDEQVDILTRYAENGGFLILFYDQPEKLLNAIGMTKGQYQKADSKRERFAEIRFRDDYAASFGENFPAQIHQRSNNIIPAAPLSDDRLPEDLRSDETRPRVAADWYSLDGTAAGEAAVLVSGRGIYWSHVFQKDGSLTERREYLTGIFSKIDPAFIKAVLAQQWRKTLEIGLDPSDPACDPDQFRADSMTDVLSALADAGWSRNQIERALLEKDVSYNERTRLLTALSRIADERMAAYCASIPSKTVEGRLWWEHSGLGIYPGDWDRTMKELSEAGFNAVLPNMFWGGSALYKSDYLPEDPRCALYGDQIAQAVEAGKKYGVAVHIWKVNWNCGRSPKSFIDQMAAEGRLQKSRNGEQTDWLCPSDPRNRQLEADVMLEAATKYDVAGIHFDYIRYDGWPYCYCDGCRERFSAHYREMTGEELTGWPESTRSNEKVRKIWDQWRRDNITGLVREVRRRINEVRPDCMVSAAVFAEYPTCCGNVAQDWGSWADEGLVDFVCPMNYTSSAPAFASMVKNQTNRINGKCAIFPGIGATGTGLSLTPEEVAMQIGITRRMETDGFTIFNLSEETAKRYFEPIHSGPTKEKAVFPKVK